MDITTIWDSGRPCSLCHGPCYRSEPHTPPFFSWTWEPYVDEREREMFEPICQCVKDKIAQCLLTIGYIIWGGCQVWHWGLRQPLDVCPPGERIQLGRERICCCWIIHPQHRGLSLWWPETGIRIEKLQHNNITAYSKYIVYSCVLQRKPKHKLRSSIITILQSTPYRSSRNLDHGCTKDVPGVLSWANPPFSARPHPGPIVPTPVRCRPYLNSLLICISL